MTNITTTRQRQIDPATWLRRRPERPECAEEFVRDFEAWGLQMLLQEGFNWGELEHFIARAKSLRKELDEL